MPAGSTLTDAARRLDSVAAGEVLAFPRGDRQTTRPGLRRRSPATATTGARSRFRNRDGGHSTNYDGIQLMSARSWAAGVPLNEALGVFRFRDQSEGGLTVIEVRRV